MIEVKNLTKTYSSYRRGHTFRETVKSIFIREEVLAHALKSISFHIGKGELIGLLGPNGAGKSTTIKILTGVLFPTSGSAVCRGYTPWKDRKKYVRNIGAVFGQKSQLIWDIPPVDAFYMNRAIYGIDRKEYAKRLAVMVELLDVADLITKPTRQLSLGERMKCEFIMAMLHNPELVFLDEPTIGLDVIAKEKIRQFIKEMNARGTTFILTTHDLDDVERLVDRVITINHGEIVFDGALSALKKRLGDRKKVHLVTEEPYILPSLPGVSESIKINPYELNLEIDLEKIKLNEFMKIIGEKNSIKDITIHDIDIEEVITNLYLSPITTPGDNNDLK